VYEQLVRPALNAAGDKKKIVFVPDGVLFGLPFAAIPDRDGRPPVLTHVVVVAPSLSAFLEASARLRGFNPSGVLAMGDGHDPRAFPLPILASGDREASDVGALYPSSDVLLGGEATRKRLLETHHAVVHFAGHTVVNHQYAMFSHLLLAPDADGNGMLTADDLVAHQMRGTGVVVLGTCEGALGRAIEGEGTVSMADMFLNAGVPSVVANVWPVDARSTPLLMAFHRELRHVGDPATALRAAQMKLLVDGHDLPVRVWGGFIALGGMKSS
jgi:CHAT domain-containing protein